MKKAGLRKFFTKKNFIKVSFVILLLFTGYLITTVLSVKSTHGVDQKEGLYWQPEDTIDVVMMGTSHVHCGINTGLLWDKYGIASYDYSGAEQPLWMTYFYLKEFVKYQSPKVVVLDVYGPARYKEDYQYDWISENIYGMKFSLNKLQMLQVSIEPNRFFDYFPSFAIYHSRYDDLDEGDFGNFFWDSRSKEAFKGYTPYWNRRPQQEPEVYDDRNDGLTAKSEEYLRKIIEFTKKNDIELVLISIPYIETNEDRRTYNRIAEIAAEEEIIYIDYNDNYGAIGLDFEQDFNDESHLNYWGSSKFTDYLGSYLVSYDEIKDNRGVPGYESWDDNVKMIQEELESYENGTLEALEE